MRFSLNVAPRLVSWSAETRHGAFAFGGENLASHSVLSGMQQFRRRLPHHYLPGKWLFVTCHLHGSLPQAQYPPPGTLSSGAAFVWMDRYLDCAHGGPMYLAHESIAHLVVASLKRGVRLGQSCGLCDPVEPYARTSIAENRTTPPAAIPEGCDRKASESHSGADRRDVLASRILRPFGQR